MVQGLEKFREKFKGFTDNYVMIGGLACYIVMDEVGMNPRATKDFDLVLIAEMKSLAFCRVLWDFIIEGEYENRKRGNEKMQFYRFTSPKNSDYPYMIELFSTKPVEFEIAENSTLTPIPVQDELDSLSAILLDEDYYALIGQGKRIVDNISTLSEEYLILMKIKAWLDLSKRKFNGEQIDSRKIKKHRNDIFKLLLMVAPSTTIKISKNIKADIDQFIEKMRKEDFQLRQIGIKQLTLVKALDRIGTIYIMN